MIKLFRDIIVPSDTGGPTDPIPQEVREKIEEAVMSIVIDRYLHQKVHLSADVKIEITSAFEQGYSLSLPAIQAQEERIRVLEQALEKIITMKREPGETNDTHAFNRCWHIATKALAGKKEGVARKRP